MASTYSTNLRLEKQADGENNSTWGAKLNVVLDLVEEALTSMETITTTSGTVTLTTNNSATDQSRKSVLKITSSLIGNLTIVVPDRNKHYLIWNASSGAFTVTVKTNAGTGIAVTQGAKRFLYCDATNVVDTTATLLASEITNTPAGNIVATTVQAAIAELDAEKLALTGGTMTGDITMSGASVFDANASIAAHATTMDPWSLGNYVTCTGAAVTFTAMANAPQAGAEVELYMNAAHVFTDGAVFEVDGDANFTAVAGDRVLLRAKSTTVFTVHPRKKDGTAVVAPAALAAASTAEVKTGTEAAKYIAPDKLLGAIGFSNMFTSAGQLISSAGGLTIAHSLGRTPKFVGAYLKCLTAEHGYAINDLVWTYVGAVGSGATTGQGISVAFEGTTNLLVRYGSTAAPVYVHNKTTGAEVALTNANWQAFFVAMG